MQKKPLRKLNARQERYVEEFLVDLNMTRAADRAGYAHPHVSGPRLYAKPHIRAAIDKAMARRNKRLQLDQDRVVQEVAKHAFTRIFEFDPNTRTFKVRADLSDDDGIVITESTTETTVLRDENGKPRGAKIKQRVRTTDRLAALEKLMKHMGAYVERFGGPDGGPLEVKVTDASNMSDDELVQRNLQIANRVASILTTAKNGAGNGNGAHPPVNGNGNGAKNHRNGGSGSDGGG